jgi:hypothetical protein
MMGWIFIYGRAFGYGREGEILDLCHNFIQIIWPQNASVIGQISKFLGRLRDTISGLIYFFLFPDLSPSISALT